MTTQTTISRLHPTLKACECGFIGTKRAFYRHLDTTEEDYRTLGKFPDFYVDHGEVPLNEDDPRLTVREAWLDQRHLHI